MAGSNTAARRQILAELGELLGQAAETYTALLGAAGTERREVVAVDRLGYLLELAQSQYLKTRAVLAPPGPVKLR